MARTPLSNPVRPAGGPAAIVIGIAAVVLSPLPRQADIAGSLQSLFSGFLVGAGLALIVLGVYLVGARKKRERSDWLPSRDGRDDPDTLDDQHDHQQGESAR